METRSEEKATRRVPSCEHGPSRLFVESSVGEAKAFYACSAFRDRALCPLYIPESDWKEQEANDAPEPRTTKKRKWDTIDVSSSSAMVYCAECDNFPSDEKRIQCAKDHGERTHQVLDMRASLSASRALKSNAERKGLAQFFFDDKTLRFLVDLVLHKLRWRKVLCLGTPRLHEALLLHDSGTRKERDQEKEREEEESEIQQGEGIESLLLDMDERYQVFYPSVDTFVRCNINNLYFFEDEKGEARVWRYLQEGCDGIILDPPYGVMADTLCDTIRRLWHLAGTQSARPPQNWSVKEGEVGVLWCFPYYLEERVREGLPSLQMLDYRVCYENHNFFHDGRTIETVHSKDGEGADEKPQTKEERRKRRKLEKAREKRVKRAMKKQRSPIRIFTNVMPLSIFEMPKEEGYRYCEACQKHVDRNNTHCDLCGCCPSKDGRTWRHCELCNKCVKPGRVHCGVCNSCELPVHQHGAYTTQGCFLCGSLEHKRRDCPKTIPLQ